MIHHQRQTRIVPHVPQKNRKRLRFGIVALAGSVPSTRMEGGMRPSQAAAIWVGPHSLTLRSVR